MKKLKNMEEKMQSTYGAGVGCVCVCFYVRTGGYAEFLTTRYTKRG